PSQSWGANLMLNILQACVPKWTNGVPLASLGPASPKYWHLLVEAKKLAYADLYRFNADPNFVSGGPGPRRHGAQGISGRWRLGRRLPIAPANAARSGETERSIPARHLPCPLGSPEGRTGRRLVKHPLLGCTMSSMSYENILVETRGRVGVIRLNRP